MDLTSPAFWAALGSILLANVLLSGDNAVVTAMAAVLDDGSEAGERLLTDPAVQARMGGHPHARLQTAGALLVSIGLSLNKRRRARREALTA